MNHQADTSNDIAPRIAYLIAGYIKQTLTSQEHDELDAWVEESDTNMQLFEELTNEDYLEAQLQQMGDINVEAKLQEAKKKLVFTNTAAIKKTTVLWPYGVAAAVIVLVIAGFLLLQPRRTTDDTAEMLMPALNRSLLTLSNGKKIVLSAPRGTTLNTDNGTTITNNGEWLSYTAPANATNAPYNTLSTSTGGRYNVVLPDGTRVWLNAASALRFPVAFIQDERVVELQGEAFFEVVKDASKPFRVMLKNNASVTVTGTQFNVHDYTDETYSEVTLVEGSVTVNRQHNQQHLVPGQQLFIDNINMQVKSNIDTEVSTGWRENRFVFYDADIKKIMREVKRWYAVEVVYEANVTELFNANISKSEPLSKLLHLLQATGKVKFKTENRKIYVLR